MSDDATPADGGATDGSRAYRRLRTAVVAVVAVAVLTAAGGLLLTAGDRAGDPAGEAHGDHAALAVEPGDAGGDDRRRVVAASAPSPAADPASGPSGAVPSSADAASRPGGAPSPKAPAPPVAFGPAVPEPEPVTYLLPDGSPAPGHDPARQEQVSLADAASRPHGPARPVGAAAGAPREAVDAPGTDAAPVDGCAVDYGVPGQCVPAQPPHAGHGGPEFWTCADLRPHFPDGVTVRGDDVWGLDADGDGVACGPAD